MQKYIDGRCDICGTTDAEGCWNESNEESIQACKECRAMNPNIIK